MPNYQGQYTQSQNNIDERIWVQGRNSAEAYLVAPNSFVRLWDSNEPVFYEKRADASGRPYPMDAYEYKRMDTQVVTPQAKDYSDEIESLKARISALEKGVKADDAELNSNDTRVSEV